MPRNKASLVDRQSRVKKYYERLARAIPPNKLVSELAFAFASMGFYASCRLARTKFSAHDDARRVFETGRQLPGQKTRISSLLLLLFHHLGRIATLSRNFSPTA